MPTFGKNSAPIEKEAGVLKTFRSISLLLPDLRGGGAERVNLDLAREFAKIGYSVEFVLMSAKGEFLSEAEEQHSVVSLGAQRTRDVPHTLARYIRLRRPDVLVASMWPLTAVAPLGQLLSGRRCRVVVVEHAILSRQYGDRGFFHKLMLRASIALSFRAVDARVSVSFGGADDLARLSMMPRTRFSVIHNPVRIATSSNSNSVDPLKGVWHRIPYPRILSVGNFKPEKNQALLLHAFSKLLQKMEATLVLLGDGALRNELEKLVQQLGLGGKVLMPGFCTDPSQYYHSANLFVLSSDHEGFGNVIVEAMSHGLPVVSTDCPSGPREILEGGKYGRLVPVGDVDALAKEMYTALNDETSTDLLKKRAKDFAPEIAANKYLHVMGLS